MALVHHIMHPYTHNNFTTDISTQEIVTKNEVKCLLFGPNMLARRTLVKHTQEQGDTLALWWGQEVLDKRKEFLSQYLLYHSPDWVVYLDNRKPTDKSSEEVAMVLDITRQQGIQLALLASPALVDNVLERVPWHDGDFFHPANTLDTLVSILFDDGKFFLNKLQVHYFCTNHDRLFKLRL